MEKQQMSHNACYGRDGGRPLYNYIIEWHQRPDANLRHGYRRCLDTYQDYTAFGALRQWERRGYVNAVVISVYVHSEVLP